MQKRTHEQGIDLIKNYRSFVRVILKSLFRVAHGKNHHISNQLTYIPLTTNNYSCSGKYHNDSHRQSAKTIKQHLKTQREQREQETCTQKNRVLY